VNDPYQKPKDYWELRLARNFDLTGVGYGLLGRHYNEIMYAARLRSLGRAFRAGGIEIRGRSVLDVGCGTGFYTELCAQHQALSYTGIDLTNVSVHRLQRQYPAFRFIRGDIASEALPLRDRFDLVIVGDVLFHIVEDGPFRQAIKNIGSWLKPGGCLALSDVLSVATVQYESHCKFRARVEYKYILAQNGMVVERVEPIFSLLQPPIRMPGTNLVWKLYSDVWRVGLMRFARHGWFDRWAPVWLEWLDRSIFLPRADVRTPNSKWLLATKRNAG